MAGIQRIADSFGLTPRRIQQLAKEPGLPKVARGDYDEMACLRWYVKFLQAKMAAGASGASGELSGKERADLAKARMAELDLAERQRQIVTVADWEQATSDLIRPACRELLAIEARLRPHIGGEAAARCGAEIRRALHNITALEEAAS